MNATGAVAPAQQLPPSIARLTELAYNLWWCWQTDARDLFRIIDTVAWEYTNHNPVAVLAAAEAARLETLAEDAEYLALYQHICAQFDAYLHPGVPTWYQQSYPADGTLIAYFCAEFGIHESVPIYSGGLGVLAGDHLKTASDLGLPLVGIGLWYTQGYFHQLMSHEGDQIAEAEAIDPSTEPLRPAGAGGQELRIAVEMAGRTVYVRVWRLQVGRVALYLLDSDVPENNADDRALCGRLYGGDRETRIAQEVLLGVGGVRALRALGIKPTVWHMNEGHAAFMGLERMREMVRNGTPFVDAWPAQAAATVFTTHTPVPAGNEVFQNDLVARYLDEMPAGLGLDMAGMLALGHEEGAPDQFFAMTPLALRLAHRANGVSALHGAVARHMWQKQFPGRAEEQVPITSITNGVHSASWIAPALRQLFARYLGADWLDRVDQPTLWDGLTQVPDAELWATHTAIKADLLDAIHTRLAARTEKSGGSSILDPRALTIGFARRFATYKRATLIFRDRERLARLLNDPARPVQLVFAGKAHPADGGGQALIKSIVELSRQPDFAGKVVFVPGYDIGLARHLVQGVDLWLNNPERPQEASGTSGEKAALNGVPNCSIRDGWWDEGYSGTNGFAFGGPAGDDALDSAQLYDLLEQQVVPAFFDRDGENLPRRWLALMKESIRTLAPTYSAQRMVKEYTERLYR